MPRFKMRALLTACAAALALAAPTGALAAGGKGSGPCELPATSKVFSKFGDNNHYYLATGGSFEADLDIFDVDLDETTAWVGDWRPVSESEPFRLTGRSADRSSIRLVYGAFATKAHQCVSQDQPHLRLVARAMGDGPLVVRVDTLDLRGEIRSAVTTIPASEHRDWAPTRFVSLDTSSMQPHESARASITIISQGDWLVDDVFIDPYAR
jgi:hypothetical protein